MTDQDFFAIMLLSYNTTEYCTPSKTDFKCAVYHKDKANLEYIVAYTACRMPLGKYSPDYKSA